MALYTTYTDGELVTLLQQSDEHAFREIYVRYREQLSGYAFNFSGNREDGLDVVQDIFASLWNLRNQLTITYSLRSYLYQAVRNGCISKITKMERGDLLLQSLAAMLQQDNFTSPHLKIEANETSRRIDEAIHQLPDKMQQVFRLSREEGLSHSEIGERLQISPHTVKAQVQNALKIIRSQVGNISGGIFVLIGRLLD